MRLALLLLAACSGPDDDGEGKGPDAEPDTWDVVAEGLGGALLSVTGTAVDDVWSVGATDAEGATVLHYDGAAWERVASPITTGLWWVWVAPDGEVWTVGDAGMVGRYDAGNWTTEVLDPAITLFGVWGASEDEVFAVGGDLDTGTGAFVYRWDGAAWAAETLPDGVSGLIAVYKVWGSSADDVWACGVDGLLMHRDGTGTWTRVDSGTGSLLLTVAGEGDRAWVVGGNGSAEIVAIEAGVASDESPDFAPELNGVSARDGEVVAVGRTGAAWIRGDSGWVEHPSGRAGFEDLHATWLDPEGGIWAVGGQIAARPLIRGTMLHLGPTDIAAVGQ